MSIEGTWNCIVDSPIGKQKSVLTLTVTDGIVSGENVGTMGTDRFTAGTAEGNTATFKIEVTKPFAMTLTWVIAVDGDTLSGEVEAGAFGKSPLSGSRA